MNFKSKRILSAISFISFNAFLCFAEGTNKVYQVQWVENFNANSTQWDTRFTPYDGNTKEELLRPTLFRVSCNESSWNLEIELDEPEAGMETEPDNVLEIFFRTTLDSETKDYYQLYGSFRNNTLDPYAYGVFSRFNMPLAFNENRVTQKGKLCTSLLIPWSNFLFTLPFDSSHGSRDWRFNIVRHRDSNSQKWQGNLHNMNQSGILRFPEFTHEQRIAIYRQLIMKIAAGSGRVPFDSERFDSECYAAWMTKLDKDLPAIAEHLVSNEKKMSVALDEYRNTFKQMRELLRTRELITTSIYKDTPAAPQWHIATDKVLCTKEYTFDNDFAGEIWITHLRTGNAKKDLKYEIHLNGKKIVSGTGADLPLNVRLPDKIKRGSKLFVAATMPLNFAIEEFHNGLRPGKAINIEHIDALEYSPKRNLDGTILTEYFSRHAHNLREIDRIKPRVFMIGDSITDLFRGEAWKKLAEFKPCNLGIGGDYTQNVMWRINNGMFASYQPELAVLLIGTNNRMYSVEEVAAGIYEILRLIRLKAPETKILLLGIFPRGEMFLPGNDIEKTNEIIAKYADGKNIFYQDIGEIFLNEDRSVRGDLLFDMLHPNQAGYEEIIRAISPTLKKLLLEKP